MLSAQSLADWLSALDENCGSTATAVEHLYSLFTMKLRTILTSKSTVVRRLVWFSICRLMRHSSTCCAFLRTGRDRTLLKTLLLKTCRNMVSHIENNCAQSALNLLFAKNEREAHLNVLVIVKNIREMLKENKFYVVDIVYPYDRRLTERSLGFERQCALSRTNTELFKVTSKLLVDCRNAQSNFATSRLRMPELSISQSELAKVKKVVGDPVAA